MECLYLKCSCMLQRWSVPYYNKWYHYPCIPITTLLACHIACPVNTSTSERRCPKFWLRQRIFTQHEKMQTRLDLFAQKDITGWRWESWHSIIIAVNGIVEINGEMCFNVLSPSSRIFPNMIWLSGNWRESSIKKQLKLFWCSSCFCQKERINIKLQVEIENSS